MKPISTSRLGCLCVSITGLLWATSGKADKIGINFQGGSFGSPVTAMGPNELAGLSYVTQQFWNNVSTAGAGSSGTLSPQGDTGGASPTNYSGFSVAYVTSGRGQTAITDSPGDFRMMKGYV